MAEDRSRSLWRHADFLKLWSGQSVSELGSQVTLLAMPLTAVLALHATAFEVGALNAIVMAPFLIFGLPVGAVVDRLPMRKVMLVSDALRFLILGSIPVAAWTAHVTLWQLYIAAFLSGICTVFFDVAYQSYLPALVSKEQLVDGNGKLTATSQIAGVAGPAAGGGLVSLVGAAKALGADAVSYVVSVASLLAIRHPEPRRERPQGPALRGLLGETREGLRFVLGQPMLRKIAGCTGTSNLSTDISFAVLTIFMVRVLHLSPAAIGGLFAIGSVAGVLGAVVSRRLIGRLGVGPTIVWSATLCSFGGVLLALATRGAGVAWIAGGMAVFSLNAVIYNVAQVSLRQALCPPDLLGRMNATMRFLVWGPMPIGALVGGALGGAIGLRPTLWVAAITGLLTPLWVIFSPVRHQRDIPGDLVEKPAPELTVENPAPELTVEKPAPELTVEGTAVGPIPEA